MNSPTPIFRLIFLLSALISATELDAQSDSILVIKKIKSADSLLSRDFPKGMKLCLELEEIIQSQTNISYAYRVHLLVGKAYWINGDYNNGVKFLKHGMKLAQQTNDSTRWASAANMIALNFYYQAYYDTAIVYFQQALAVHKSLRNKAGMAQVLGNISLMYHRKGDYQKTVEYLLQGEELNDELRDEPRSIGDFPGMENIFPDSVYFREEMADNLRSLNVHLKNGDQGAAAGSYSNLAVASNQLKDYLTAARYYVKSYSIGEKLGYRVYWDNAAINYREADLKDSCFYYHAKAKQDFVKSTQITILSSYELLGDSHVYFDQYDSALRNYTIAMQMNQKCNNRLTIAGLHRRMADVYVKQRKFNEAENHIHQGIALAKQVSIAHQRSLFRTAAELYALKGDHKKALHFQTRYATLVDSLSKIETALNLTRLLAQYKTSKKERELAGLKIEKENSDLVLKNRNITLLSLTGITLISFIFIVVFVMQRNKIKKKNIALDQANKEQEALLKEIHHRVKNNLQIISSLINLKAAKASAETSEVLYQLNGRIYSMGLIHERLYQKNEFQLIALNSYLTELSRFIMDSFESDQNIELKSSCEDLQIDIDRALTCGLIINELLTNSVKYAFNDHQAHRVLNVELTRQSGLAKLLIADNGKNATELPENIHRNFGLRFVDQLVKSKLNGDWAIEVKNGFCVIIKFPIASLRHE